MTTEIVPDLLDPCQRALLLLGLRARVVLELCHSEPIADLRTIQPHLDRIQTLMASWGKEVTSAEEQLPKSSLLGLIPILLKEQDQKSRCFFQDVFPVEVRLKYDSALQTLVWHFLSRLEKLLQVPQLREVASLLSDVPSVLEECFVSVSDLQELKSLLLYQKNVSQLEDNDVDFSSCGDCILRALSFPHMEEIVTVNEPTATGEHVGPVSDEFTDGRSCDAAVTAGLRICIGDVEQIQQSRTEGHAETSKQPVHIDDTAENVDTFFDTAENSEDTDPVTSEQDTIKERDLNNVNSTEDTRSSDIESEDAGEKVEVCKTPIVVGEDKIAEPFGLMASNVKDLRNKSEDDDTAKSKQQQKNQDVTSMPTLLLFRSERPNRGLKMKTFLAQGRKPVKMHLLDSVNSRPLSLASDAEQRQCARAKQQTYPCHRCGKYLQSHLKLKRHVRSFCSDVGRKSTVFKCTVCGKTFPRAAQVKCHMISHSSERPYHCSNCERSFKHLSSMKAHEEACKYASQQQGELSSRGHGSTTADNTSDPHQLLLSTKCLQGDNLKAVHHDAETSDPFNRIFQVLPQPNMNVDAQEREAETLLGSLAQSACTEAIRSSEEIAQHKMTHSSDVIYNCGNCQKTYKYFRNFQKHKDLCEKDTNQNWEENEPEAAHETIEKWSSEKGESVSGVPIKASSTSQLSPSGTKLESSELKNTVDGKAWHSRRPLNENLLSSPHCGITCETRGGRMCHVRQIRKVRSVKHDESPKRVGIKKSCKCEECGKEFGLRSTLRAHKLTHNSLYCAACGKVCPDAKTLHAHSVTHRPVRCTMCDKSFNVVRFLIKHYLDAHRFSGPFVCAHCRKSYSELGALIRHERTHTGDLPFCCAKCPKRFNRHVDLVYHDRKHTGEKRFLCWECGRAFSTNEILKKHMERHSGQHTHFSCPQCKRTFWTRKAVDAHVQIHHKGMRFPCSHCGKLFLSRSALRRHDLIHTGEKPFVCTYQDCAKSFRSGAELRIHTRYHTGERPFKCQICEKGFVQAHYLTIHLRSHTQERPYACPNCERRFTTCHQLNRHKLVHTGEKPFRCEVCDEGFSRRHRLKAHQDKYHK
ncbi:zinc finger protein 11-like isoform X2 [Myripristis murdjan]|nr:zinc finger protein 11-like isoform X2 [Myripristis murdjan]